MRELNMIEIENVAGAGALQDFAWTVGSMVLGGMMGFSSGIYKSAMAGSTNGGLLGVGVLGAAVGALIGGIGGIVQGTLYGLVNGYDKTAAAFTAVSDQWWNQKIPVPSA